MADLEMKRHFKADIARVWAFVTEPQNLQQWWGPEGMTVPVHNLDFTRTGPWFSEMHSPDGQVFKVSGQVTSINPPHSLGFTWGWHDETDQRGPESHVMFILRATDTGTEFTLNHRELDAEAAQSHEEGWTSTLVKLERMLA